MIALMRAMTADPDDATPRQRLAGALLLLVLIAAAGLVPIR